MHWSNDFYHNGPAYSALLPLQPHVLGWRDWPRLEQLQQLLQTQHGDLRSGSAARIRFVEQDAKSDCLEQTYEPRIYLKGEIQTRKNWHDVFNALVWMTYPRSKTTVNKLHFHAIQNSQRENKTGRGPAENALTLFDEGGALLVSSDLSLLETVRDMQWTQLFLHRRRECMDTLRCFIFGHALFEKAMTPYVGMCANAVLLKVPESFLRLTPAQHVRLLDQWGAHAVSVIPWTQGPRLLTPFPLLGLPGWYANETEGFYQNRDYFRPAGRSRCGVILRYD